MGIFKTYSNEEIEQAISKLSNALDKALDKRSELTKEINAIKKNIEYYKNLDKRQIRIEI